MKLGMPNLQIGLLLHACLVLYPSSENLAVALSGWGFLATLECSVQKCIDAIVVTGLVYQHICQSGCSSCGKVNVAAEIQFSFCDDRLSIPATTLKSDSHIRLWYWTVGE